MQKLAQRAREENGKILDSKNFKQKYVNLQELGKDLQENPSHVSYEKEDGTKASLKSKLVQSSSKHYHLIFYDEELLSEFKDESVFIDGTFKSRPNVKGVVQLLTVMGKRHNKVKTPIF